MAPVDQSLALPDVSLYVRLLAQAVSLVALGFAAWWTSGLLRTPRDESERGLAALLLLLAAMTMLPAFWGVLGLLHPVTMAGSTAVLFGAAFAKAAPARRSQAAPPATGRMPPVLAALGWALCALALPPLLRAVFEVPIRWDTLTYHLFLPAMWIESGHVFNPDMAYPLKLVAHYPKHQELFLTTTMAVARADLFAELASFVVYLAGPWAVFCLAGRLGAGRSAAFAAGAFAWTLPAHFAPAAGAYAEGLLVFAIVAALVFLVAALGEVDGRAAAHGSLEAWVLAGVATGLAVGTKYTALPFAAAALLGAALSTWRLPRAEQARRLGVFLAAALALGGIWYAINLLGKGNPFYPVPLGPLPGVHRIGLPWEGSSILENMGSLVQSGALQKAWLDGHPKRPWMPTFGWKAVPSVLLGVVGAVVLVRARVRGAGVVVLAACALILAYLRAPYWQPGWLHTQTRLAVPALFVCIALGFAALGRARLPAAAWVAIVLGGLALDARHLDLLVPDLAWHAELGRFVVEGRGVPVRLARGRMLVAGVALVVFSLSWWRLSRGARAPSARRRGLGLAVCVLVLALVAAPWVREPNRYDQYERVGPFGPKRRYAPAAAWAEAHHPARPIAAASSGALEFLYLFVGRDLDRRVRGGRMRPGESEEVWRERLVEEGHALLVTMRWPRRDQPPELAAARSLGLVELHADESVAVFEIAPAANAEATGARP